MGNDELIAEMRKCDPHCRIGILRSKVHTNLCWISNKHIHTERIANPDLITGGDALKAALSRAKSELRY